MRVYIEALLLYSHPHADRVGAAGPREVVVSLNEIIKEWLQNEWAQTDCALTDGLIDVQKLARQLNGLFVQIEDHKFYCPVRLVEYDVERVFFLVGPFPGSDGPQISRSVLRAMGKVGSPEYRAYLNLCIDWDRAEKAKRVYPNLID